MSLSSIVFSDGRSKYKSLQFPMLLISHTFIIHIFIICHVKIVGVNLIDSVAGSGRPMQSLAGKGPAKIIVLVQRNIREKNRPRHGAETLQNEPMSGRNRIGWTRPWKNHVRP